MPAAPRLGAIVRVALSDFYFNSWRLVPANVLWGVGAVVVGLAWLVWPIGAVLLSPLLALPTAGVFRLAARIARNEVDISFGDALAAYRAYAAPALLLGLAFVAANLVLGTNVVAGLTRGDVAGWAVGTLAGWGLVFLWCGAIVGWPILVDPHRADRSVRERLRLAGLVLIAYPIRFAAVGSLVASVVVVSMILPTALLTISVAFVALVSCRCVYPAADDLEIRLAGDRP